MKCWLEVSLFHYGPDLIGTAKKIILIIIFINFINCGTQSEKVDNCTFVKKWDIFRGLSDIAISFYPSDLYVLHGAFEYITHFVGEVPVNTIKIVEIPDHAHFPWRIAVSNNYIYIYSTVLPEFRDPPEFCLSLYGLGYGLIEKYSLDGELLNMWGCSDIGLDYYQYIIDTIVADDYDNFFILVQENQISNFSDFKI